MKPSPPTSPLPPIHRKPFSHLLTVCLSASFCRPKKWFTTSGRYFLPICKRWSGWITKLNKKQKTRYPTKLHFSSSFNEIIIRVSWFSEMNSNSLVTHKCCGWLNGIIALEYRSSIPGWNAWRSHCVVFLGKTRGRHLPLAWLSSLRSYWGYSIAVFHREGVAQHTACSYMLPHPR